MTRHLRAGVHKVRVNGVLRKVRVDRKGRWHFMKMHKHRGTRCPRCHRKY